MILKQDFEGIIELSTHVRDSQLSTYINRAKELGLEAVLGKEIYDTFFATYDIVKTITSFVVGSTTLINLSDTTALQGFDFAYFYGITGDTTKVINEKRLNFEILSSTQIKVNVNTTGLTLTSGFFKFICKKEDFDAMRPYMVCETFSRYAPESVIQSTNSGLKQKTDDFSEFISPQLLGGMINSIRADKVRYEEKLRKHFEIKPDVLQEYSTLHQVKRQVPSFKLKL